MDMNAPSNRPRDFEVARIEFDDQEVWHLSFPDTVRNLRHTLTQLRDLKDRPSFSAVDATPVGTNYGSSFEFHNPNHNVGGHISPIFIELATVSLIGWMQDQGIAEVPFLTSASLQLFAPNGERAIPLGEPMDMTEPAREIQSSLRMADVYFRTETE